ncbi:hypothetical protein HanRHA438_Chr16g0767901 [Helianthus annuus]|nr:hypothetical protein HanRHA438_Chr16g0767901 [Helianthus annuus]
MKLMRTMHQNHWIEGKKRKGQHHHANQAALGVNAAYGAVPPVICYSYNSTLFFPN